MNKLLYRETLKKYFEPELLFWIVALLYLSLINVEAHTHFSFCPLHNLGIEWCPGCGLGRSISYLLHGNILQSFEAHWLGPIAFLIILFRIYQLIRNLVLRNKIIYQ
ncbi:MAG: hypothetical protein A2X61_03015 [Ignavibacteria bacterium GWB2_35_12]|nr:MAG: hypothetical protein A2X63_11535 [Ignavibacteria bacterium GWA2_35_8]OGU38311.1 MAG: hypothetical protein A2X61_03015 [Ignavibacteria bacterium GWB2_35_12]OGU95510.1 MAG: hypothetical protein A2220_07190 [Ignavibacteria bacterium RIFOXYA2_FULL_35_10]OGV20850.1 MAG: hypothetical protein A2475_11530 [Ignavibacteria bacterium RIFOXYC2_FULL_35_21]